MYSPAVSPLDDTLMFVQCDMGGLYRSSNGGTTWTMVNGRQMTAALNEVRCPVAFDPTPSGRIYAYGAYRGIRRSDDGGVTWPAIVIADPGGGLGVTALAVHPVTGDVFLYGTEAGVFTLGGTKVLDGVVTKFFVDPSSPSTCFVGIRGATSASPPGGVFQSSNGGQTWAALATQGLPAAAPVLDFGAGRNAATGIVVLYVTVVTAIVAGSVEGGVYRLANPGAASWTRVMGPDINTQTATPDTDPPRPPPARYDWLGVSAVDPDTVLVSVWGTHSRSGFQQNNQFLHTGVFRTTNAGANWAHVFFYVNYNLPQPSPSQVNLDGGWFDWDVGFGSGGPALIRDPNLGHAGGFAISPTNPNIAMFTNKDALYVTKNALSASPAWEALYTEAAGSRAKSQPWASKGLEVTTTWHYEIDPTDPLRHYLCYTDIGFARSTDRGETWRHGPPRNRKPPQVAKAYNTVYKVACDRTIAGRMFAACSDQHDIPYEDWLRLRYGGGVARSDNYGADWLDVTGNLPASPLSGAPPFPVTSVELDQTTKRLWAGVFDSGVWSSDDASTLVAGSGATSVAATWIDQSANLPANNRNTFRLYLAPSGDLYCGITGKKPQGGPFVAETGLWLLPAGTAQWKRLTPAPSQTATAANMWWLLDYGVHPTNPGIVYVCTSYVGSGSSGTGSALKVPGGVFRTTNASAATPSWEPVLLLQGSANVPATVPVLPVAYRDFVQAFSAVFDPRDPTGNVVYATTRTHGIWKTRNGGDPTVLPTWEEHKALPFMSTHWLAFDGTGAPNRSSVFITTFGGGAWDPVDVSLRDFVGDDGNPHVSWDITQSPDIILRQSSVANPQGAFGQGSGTENNNALSDAAEKGQTNYVYVRVRNRGPRDASNVRATAYWSEPAALVTPSMWNLIGSTIIPTVPQGNALTVSDAIAWNTVPATGHYCFVVLLDAATDPEPDRVALGNFDNYIALIRRENNVAWRNFEVIDLVPDIRGPENGEAGVRPETELRFVMPGADDRETQMELEVSPKLPDGAEVELEIPVKMLERMARRPENVSVDKRGKVAKIKLKPRGRQRLGKTKFRKKSRDRLRLHVRLPGDLSRPHYDIVVRQLWRDTGVGTITFRLRRPRRSKRTERGGESARVE